MYEVGMVDCRLLISREQQCKHGLRDVLNFDDNVMNTSWRWVEFFKTKPKGGRGPRSEETWLDHAVSSTVSSTELPLDGVILKIKMKNYKKEKNICLNILVLVIVHRAFL